jgi:hypothetical protein
LISSTLGSKGVNYFASLGREYLIAQVIYIGLPVIVLAYQISWTLRIYETVS